ncbi:MAG: DUF3991 and toprim domain-containing protein [Defluviitaleaceae bacterium]|nr:DUF3991 and toprim domain-containing protein [Defluviitaleaceae bacterium]
MLKLTEEQIQKARSVDLLDYLLIYEPANVRKSKDKKDQYEMVEHDSLKMSNGKWFRHSTQYGGHSALDFLVKVRNIHFVDAVLSLTDGTFISDYQADYAQKSSKAPAPPKPFILPKPNQNVDRVVAYLRGRGIGRSVIYRCINAGLLYESIKHNCVFVGKDDKGIARFACERSITNDLKKDVTGSNKRYSFTIPPIEPNGQSDSTLALFESPIDCMAHSSIHEIGQTGWDGHRLSLGGVSSAALYGLLERNPKITNIQFCLDNDKAGADATNRIIKELLNEQRYSHMKITIAPPPIGKDYADTLLAIKQNNLNKSIIDRPKEAAF